MLILGIDPGSRITGYGVINCVGNKNEYVASGCIRIKGEELPERLQQVYSGVSEVIDRYCPQEMAIEQAFMARNADSALKLGQARGAALVAAMQCNAEVFEYTPTRIKQAIVGRGHADKVQVQHMVRMLLNLSEAPQADQADALAAAICHGHSRLTSVLLKTSPKTTRRAS